jgi:RimJ/RimL family protein N-acetyltransferase
MALQLAANPGSATASRRDVQIRRIRAADAPELRRFYLELSDESRRRRFLGFTRGLSDAQADRFCQHGFVATARSGSTERIVGHLSLEQVEPHVEEVAVAVADEWQHQGVGRELYAVALQSAESRGVRRLEATMFAYNTPIRRLLTGAGRPYRISSDELGTLNLTIALVGSLDEGSGEPVSSASPTKELALSTPAAA